MIHLSFILHALIAFGAFQAIFLSIIFFTRKKGGLTDKFLALFLTIEGITLIERLLAETKLIEAFPHLLGISYPINFIKPPLLFFMTLAIVYPNFKLRFKHLLHAIPFFILLAINIPFYGMSATDKLAYVANFITYVPSYNSFDFWLFISFYLYIGAYLLLSISKLKSFKEHIKNNRHANWYHSVLRLYLLGLAIGFAYFLIRPSGLVEIPLFNLISMLVMTFLIQSIAYNFITQNNLFNRHTFPTLYDLDQRNKDADTIRNKLEVEKAYLDDTITLTTFSESLELSKKYVSDLINQQLGYTFREAINYYRVEEAKKLMQLEGQKNGGLIQIGMKSGFNNKVSFYRTFKRFTGKSPSEYVDTTF
ncbi:helix-turn-helix domain-containing protein [Ekhidna sp.]|uniref:AraC family transcriptional regulator n=1 Tax=Ekhidna sp. TaxID=2608089 RepID=UPI00329951D6